MIRCTPQSRRTGNLYPTPALYRSVDVSLHPRAAAFQLNVLDHGLLAGIVEILQAIEHGADECAPCIAVRWQRQVEIEVRQTQPVGVNVHRSEENTSELQSLMRISYAVSCMQKQKYIIHIKVN